MAPPGHVDAAASPGHAEDPEGRAAAGGRHGPSPALRLVLDTVSSPTLLTGLYAWGISLSPTVLLGLRGAFAGESSAVPLRASLLALLALPVLVASASLRNVTFPVARALGIWGFLGLSTASFLTGPAAIDASRIDAVRGALASLGFVLYALSWGTPYTFYKPPPEAHPRADVTRGYSPRGRLPPLALAIAGWAIIASAVMLALAFRPSDGPRALVSHTVAGAASVLLVTAAAQIAAGRGGYVAAPPGARFGRASKALAFLVFFLFVGVLHTVLNRLVSAYSARVARVVDVVSLFLLLLASAAFVIGLRALTEKDDLPALYALVVGGLALKGSVDLLRGRAG